MLRHRHDSALVTRLNIDWIVFYAVSAIFQPVNVGLSQDHFEILEKKLKGKLPFSMAIIFHYVYIFNVIRIKPKNEIRTIYLSHVDLR